VKERVEFTQSTLSLHSSFCARKCQ